MADFYGLINSRMFACTYINARDADENTDDFDISRISFIESAC